MDLVFQSVAVPKRPTQRLRHQSCHAAGGPRGGPEPQARYLGNNVMYFETGQEAACRPTPTTASISKPEARAYAVARHFEPLLVNTVVGLSVRVSLRRQADYSRRAGGSFLRQADGLPSAATSAITTRKRIRIWTPC